MAMYEWCKATRSPLQKCTYSNVPQPSLLPKISLHRYSIRPNARNTMVILGNPRYWKGRCKCSKLKTNNLICLAYRWDDEEIAADNEGISFEVGVFLFKSREYYRCHDVFERLWNHAEEPQRTLLHGILQCCVGFYHLFNQNHHGAMVELGEGLNKLHKLKFSGGPFHQFEQDISTVLEFIYHTQMEHAACTDDYCLTMDGSARSYQLLGNFGAGQPLYEIRRDSENGLYIYFNPKSPPNSDSPLRVKVPVLQATEEDLKDCAKH